MSDVNEEQAAAPKPAKRRGRPPGPQKTRKRHEVTAAPVDGDYQPLDVVGKEPGFNYVAMSARDRQRRGHQYEVVKWSEKCAHSPWEVFTEELRGKDVMINGQLTLMRIPTARDEARKKRERDNFRAAASGISAQDAERGHSPSAKTMVTHDAIPVGHIY